MGSAFYLGEQKITNVGIKVEGQGLDTSKGNATETDIAENMIAYVKGKEVIGSVPVTEANIAKSFTGGTITTNNNGNIGIYKQTDSHMLLREGSVVHVYTNASNFGTATIDDVVNTKTFTSENGIALSGNVAEKKEGELFSASGTVTFSDPGAASFRVDWNTAGNNLLRQGVNVRAFVEKDIFGNATADQVLANCYFTSEAGLKKSGNIVTKSDSDITVTNSNITIPKGYYPSDVNKEIAGNNTNSEYFGWHAEDVEGADYNFILQDDGYYKSQNGGQANSAALCKINFKVPDNYNLYIDCIYSGEGGYDYALLSLVNTDLSTTNTVDNSSLLKTTIKGSGTSESNITQTVTYDSVSEGYIIIKFRKDGSGDKGADCLRFKVRIEPESLSAIDTTKEATPSQVLSGRQFINSSGAVIEGTMATITQATPTISVETATGKIIATSTQNKSGYMVSGTKQNETYLTTKSGDEISPSDIDKIAINAGTYALGDIIIKGDEKLTADNIKSGVSIFGVTGTYSGEGGVSSGSWAKVKATSVSLGSLSSYGSTSITIPYGSDITVTDGALALSGIKGGFVIDKTNTEDDCNNLLGYFISISGSYGSTSSKIYYIPPTATFTINASYTTSITCNEANEIVILA